MTAVFAAAARLQELVPDAVLVGGTAAVHHAGHRASLDDYHVVADLRERFDDVLAALEETGGWVTSRVQRPVMILGRLDGVETGVRNLIRRTPLEVETTVVGNRDLRVPTLPAGGGRRLTHRHLEVSDTDAPEAQPLARIVDALPVIGGLAALRRSHGLTQVELARRMGISQSDLSKLERRRDIRLSTLRFHAAALGGDIRILFRSDVNGAPLQLRAPAPGRSGDGSLTGRA